MALRRFTMAHATIYPDRAGLRWLSNLEYSSVATGFTVFERLICYARCMGRCEATWKAAADVEDRTVKRHLFYSEGWRT